ncbi:uncharacterized protein LOC120124205 [Hibiscus syriacus]|uniref:uncharacterized protein LOC120124205 n=1 Tax=Hibiscus syriacus TaxID=106335 RepID=UPI001920B875|nr:uncharacterized protein LOC120124205 [Hibiscus syriacus]
MNVVEAHAAGRQKLRAVERNKRLYRLVVANPSVLEQVDAVVFPRDKSGETYIHASLNSRTGLSEVHGDRRRPNGAVGCPIKVDNGEWSDAESFCPRVDREGNCLLPTKELTAKIHKIELHAYRCILEALYASGTLSWEQETLVTNLRLSLHISNDEHLMELRNLVSADSSIPIR